jgi:hypothetical protein
MESKLVLTLSFAGVLALSVGFAEILQSTKVSAEEQPKLVEQTDITTVITKEEQNRVENSSAKVGFVPQENRTGFYFTKEKLLTEGSDNPTVITVEEQNSVETMLKNMPTGFKKFVPQENGTGFYVSKAK